MNNTIFDDVFRTMIEKMPYLAVPLINEVFHTSYPEDVKITQLAMNISRRMERSLQTLSADWKENVPYRVSEYRDMTMVIRMIEYDFAIGIEHAEKQDATIRIEFPKSCVLFLRSYGEYTGLSGNRCSFSGWKYIFIFHTCYKKWLIIQKTASLKKTC